jgi:hypothetical protein
VKKILLSAGVLVAALAAVAAVRIGPRNILGMLRYDQRREGRLRVGDVAPDVELVRLDGSPTRLSAAIARRPVVLVFGSYT